MRRLSGLYLLESRLSDCYLLISVVRFVFCPVLSCEIAIFLYWNNYFRRPNFSNSWTFHAFRFGLNLNCKATITQCDLSATILFKLVDSYLSLSNLHNNVASIQKNRGDQSHRVIVA